MIETEFEEKPLTHEQLERQRQLLQDVAETPVSKKKQQGLSQLIKIEEKSGSFEQVVVSALSQIQECNLPQKVNWKVFIDLADYAKRMSKFEQAKYFFKIAIAMQPFAHQGWLEFAKMEEECGNQAACREIIFKGLRFNPLSENLFIKAIKVEERLGNHAGVRKLISELKKDPGYKADKVWKILLESALYEGRQGNLEEARRQFRRLFTECQNQGQVYLEACRLEERENQLEQAIEICDEGLSYNPKCNALWFEYLRLYEKASSELRARMFDPSVDQIGDIIYDMMDHIGKDKNYKIDIELAQTFDRLGDDRRSLDYLMSSIRSCQENIKWKIWIVASRIMQNQGQMDQARLCIEKACMDVSAKKVSEALIEYAKYFEMIDEQDRALAIMESTRTKFKGEWKTQFEAVMMYMRCGKLKQAEDSVRDSLKTHFATGRLWSVLIQLLHAKAVRTGDFSGVFQTIERALLEIPKSGEVWCEAARLCMARQPVSQADLDKAEKYLDFAIQFTPQYGDSFLEVIRLCNLLKKTSPSNALRATKLLQATKQNCIHSEPSYGVLWFFFKNSVLDNAIETWDNACQSITNEQQRGLKRPTWLGSVQLASIIENGMKIGTGASQCTYEQKMRVVYGYEQLLPPISH